MSSQCLTPASRKIDCKQTHYTTFLIKSWIPVSSTDRLFLRLSYLSILFCHSAERIQNCPYPL
ncbi:MAG: hypothetical protein ACR5LA_12975 [Wolbachia sp.]